MQFVKATKAQARLRLGLVAQAGGGKTYSALAVATNLGKRVALIDTERGSASKYSDLFSFDVLQLESYSPQTYIDAIKVAEEAGYDVLVIDSLSHAWTGKDGALEMVDRVQAAGNKNSYTAWRNVTPVHNALIDAMLNSKCHVIATMRAKTEYVLEPDIKGRQVPRKIGLAPVQREGMDFEFDVVGTLDDQHNLLISKTRCAALDGKTIEKPGKEFADTLKAWLSDGTPIAAPAPMTATGTPTSSAPAQTVAGPAKAASTPVASAPTISRDTIRAAANAAMQRDIEKAKIVETIKAVAGVESINLVIPEHYAALEAALGKLVAA